MDLFGNGNGVSYHSGDVITSGVAAPKVSRKYQSLIDANPYRNAEYTVSPWNQFLNWLGFRTSADAWKENMSVQASEYDAQILQKQYDEDYNSPSSQVDRMRQAGLNPDLDGGSSIDSGSAQNLGEDPSTPMMATGDDVQVMQFASGVLGAFSQAIGLAQSVQGVVRNRLENNLLSLQGETANKDLASQLAISLLPETPEDMFDSDGNPVGDWKRNALESAKLYVGHMPKKMQKRMLRSIEHFWSTAPTSREAYEEWSKRVSSRKDYFMDSSYFYSESDDVLRVITDGLQEMNEKIYKMHQHTQETAESAETAENINAEQYANSLDASLQAQAENAQNNLGKANAEMQGIMRSTLRDMISGLDRASKEKGFKGGIASIAKTLLAMMELYISTQGLPSVSRSSSMSNGRGYGPGLYESGSHSQSIGISF